MAISLACKDLGADCEHLVQGENVVSIVTAMQAHAIDVHGYTKSVVLSEEMEEQMRNAVRQSSRPQEFRTSRLDL